MRRILLSLVSSLIVFLPLIANASGLRVPIDNGLGTPGNAGSAALAEDASTGVTNPAGLIRVKNPELVVGVSPVFSSVNFKGTVTIDRPVNPPDPITGETTAHLVAPLLAVHYAHPLTENITYAFGLTNPFGQGVEFGDNSLVNSTVTTALLITWNLSNSFGYRINDNWSIGAGFDAQRLDFEADNIYPSLLAPGSDIYTSNKADGWGFGYHAGVLYQMNQEKTRIGFNYRSQVDHKATGRSFATQDYGDLGTTIETKDFSVELSLPPIFTLSGYHHVTEKLALMGTAEYLMWGVFDEIKFENIANNDLGGGEGTLISKQSYKNSWVFNAGGYYHMNEDLRFGLGIRIDRTPTNKKYVNVEFPESDFWALGGSVGYQFNKVARLELGYTHSFYKSIDIDATEDASGVNNNGKGRLYADLINSQLTINLAPMFRHGAEAV